MSYNTNYGIENTVKVKPGDDLAAALSTLGTNGGGVLLLDVGTYYPSSHLIVPSNVRIQGVGSNATIIDFNNQAYQIQALGSSGAHLSSIFMEGFSVYNSTLALINAQYLDTFEVFDIQCYNGATGFTLDNVTINTIENVVVGACNSGIVYSNGSNFSYRNLVISTILTGHGISFDTVLAGVIIIAHIDTIAGDGMNFDDCDGLTINMYTIDGCDGNGITLDGVASSIGINNGQTSNCTGDGIKLISANNCQIYGGGSFTNTGYGFNVSNAGCTKTQIAINILSGNTAGAVHDSGTSTQIRSNIGVADN